MLYVLSFGRSWADWKASHETEGAFCYNSSTLDFPFMTEYGFVHKRKTTGVDPVKKAWQEKMAAVARRRKKNNRLFWAKKKGLFASSDEWHAA